MLSRMKKVVKTVVGRPRQVSSVNGLKRYLAQIVSTNEISSSLKAAYTAATDTGLHDRFFLGEVNRLAFDAAPEEAIWKSCSAERMSKEAKRRRLTRRPIQVEVEGKREKRGNNSGA